MGNGWAASAKQQDVESFFNWNSLGGSPRETLPVAWAVGHKAFGCSGGLWVMPKFRTRSTCRGPDMSQASCWVMRGGTVPVAMARPFVVHTRALISVSGPRQSGIGDDFMVFSLSS